MRAWMNGLLALAGAGCGSALQGAAADMEIASFRQLPHYHLLPVFPPPIALWNAYQHQPVGSVLDTNSRP